MVWTYLTSLRCKFPHLVSCWRATSVVHVDAFIPHMCETDARIYESPLQIVLSCTSSLSRNSHENSSG